ncbi:glycosyltransferase [Methylorubrum podarium]|uniref:glycosyltransferase n=1 Tax=Methylorubrum podarium TaxID=200476 RepID=UPI001EE38F08|nr:glycosyltransferase [Methylorubrum podarium]GJE68723.1 UDP-N-acetylglucosamine--N-acetylmuramyl-(pentapeptide) pyrophosphoryl-undecaprenol N-acetylglucosamine transferase [Methylorubrum podarium]
MTRPVGYYVHHQGAGHLQRAIALARALDALGRRCTLMGSFSGLDISGAPGPVLDLPDDRLDRSFDGQDGADQRPECFHYVPLNHPGIRARMGRIAAWAAEHDPALIVVDVSAEVALLARLLSVPSLVVRLSGTRTDRPHLEAFRAASRLLAPFPEALDGGDVPAWIREKTLYGGFLGGAPVKLAPEEDGRIVVVFGRGGEGGRMEALIAAAAAVPDRAWHVLGPVTGTGSPPDNLNLHGWVTDVRPHLVPASLVVGGAGDGLVTAVAALGKRFLCLPEPRAYDEQGAKADALERLGAAVVHRAWPEAAAWPKLVADGLALDPGIVRRLAEPDALARTAAAIDALCQDAG